MKKKITTTPYLKLTPTMVNKYIIDAKAGLLNQFNVTLNGTDIYVRCRYPMDKYLKPFYQSESNMNDVLIKFYKTARGDKRMSIPQIRKCAEVGDYVWFTKAEDDDGEYYNIHISKELPSEREAE